VTKRKIHVKKTTLLVLLLLWRENTKDNS